MNKKNLTVEKTFALAQKNHKKNNFKVAEKLYKEILKTHPNHFQSIYLLGSLSLQSKNLKQAKQLFDKALKINPNHPDTHNNLGLLFIEFKEFQKAVKCFQKAIEIQPNYSPAHNNLGLTFKELGEFKKAISCYQKALKLMPSSIAAQTNISNIYSTQLDNFEKAINESYKTLKMHSDTTQFINQKISLYRLKHDVQQAKYLSSKNYKINGIEKFQKIGSEILKREGNRENNKTLSQKILLNHDEIKSLLPYYKANHIYQTKKISTYCINPNKNWQDVEEQYFNSSKQIIYIDNFLSDEAIRELREFCLVSKIWSREYIGKYLGAFSDKGFISPMHLQIAVELKQKLPKLFGKHNLDKFWGFKYDSTLGEGIGIHADFALINLNFWITPDEFNNDKNAGGLKVYDAAAPENWTFHRYNRHTKEIYQFLNEKKANCINVPYKFNRAVLFNSAYFHETDKINFKDEYQARRINITYLFGTRLVKKIN